MMNREQRRQNGDKPAPIAGGIDLSQVRRVVPEGTRGKFGMNVVAFPRTLDEKGQVDCEIVNTPQGPMQELLGTYKVNGLLPKY